MMTSLYPISERTRASMSARGMRIRTPCAGVKAEVIGVVEMEVEGEWGSEFATGMGSMVA